MSQTQISFKELVQSWLKSKTAHLISATVVFAVPMTVVFCMKLHARGALTPISTLVILGMSAFFGFLAALGMWEMYFKKRRLRG